MQVNLQPSMKFLANLRQLGFIFALVGLIAHTGHTETTASSDTSKAQDTLPVYELGEVVLVRANPATNDISQAQFSSSDIRTSGATTFASALATQPGLIVTAGAKGETRLQLRGFQSEEITILLDGRPINLPYYGDLDLASIPLSNISRVRVLKGPVPVIYGANTMGGVVNIVSQRATAAPFRELRFAGGPEQSYQGIMNYGVARGPFDYWLSMGVSSTDGYRLSSDYIPEPLEDGDLRYNSAQQHFNIEGKANYVMKDSTLLSLSTGYYDAERELPTGTDRAVFQHFSLWRRWYLDAGGDGRLGNSLFWRAKLYYDDADNRLQRYNDSIMVDSNLVFDSYHDSYDFGGNLTTTAKLSSKLENTSGATVRVDAIRKQDDIGEPWLTGKNVTLSAFDQVCYSPMTSLRVETGLSVNRMEASEANAEETALDPFASMFYNPIAWLELRAAVASATRFPTLNHLYSTESGNPELKPERALKYDLGYALELTHSLSWSQTYFRSDVDDLIDRKSKRDIYENLHQVELEGLESGVTLTGWRNLSASLNYTYLEAVELHQEGTTITTLRRQHQPRHKTDVLVSYRTSFGIEIVHTGQYIADRVDRDLQALPDYYIAHLKVSQQVRPGLRLFANVRNMFDKNYVEEKYYPMPGRLIQVGADVLF